MKPMKSVDDEEPNSADEKQDDNDFQNLQVRRSSNDRADSTPSSCSIVDRKNFYESLTRSTKTDKPFHSSVDFLTEKPKKKPSVVAAHPMSLPMPRRAKPKPGGLVVETLQRLQKEVEEKKLVALDKKLQLTRQLSYDPRNSYHPELRRRSICEEDNPNSDCKETSDKCDRPEMPSTFYSPEFEEPETMRPRTKTMAPFEVSPLPKHKEKSSGHAHHSTFYTPSVHASDTKSKHRHHRKVRHHEQATIAEALHQESSATAEGLGFDVIDHEEFAPESATRSHESMKDTPDSGLGIDEKNELLERQSEIAIQISNRKKSLFRKEKAKTVNLASPSLEEESGPLPDLPSPALPEANLPRSESVPNKNRFQNMFGTIKKRRPDERHTTDNVVLPKEMTMNKSIDKMNIYQSKSLSDNKPGSQSDSSGFSGGSISMPSNSDPSISDHTMFPPIEDEESQRVSGDRNTITISTFDEEFRTDRSSTSDSLPKLDGDDPPMNYHSDEDLLYKDTFQLRDSREMVTRSDTVTEPDVRRTEKRWPGPETMEANERAHLTLRTPSGSDEWEMSPRKHSGGFTDVSMPDEYKGLVNLSQERKTTILENEDVRLFQEQDNDQNEERPGSSLLSPIGSADSSACSTRENSPERSTTWPKPQEPVQAHPTKRVTSAPVARQIEQRQSAKKPARRISRQETFHASSRKLWQDLEEVKSSGILDRLNRKQIKFNEVMYEFWITEQSYLKTLETACDVFLEPLEQHALNSEVKFCTKFEIKKLFANIPSLRDLAQKLLVAIDEKQGGEIEMQNFLPEVTHFLINFYPPLYKSYAREKKEQERTLAKVLQNTNFRALLESLQQDKKCRGQDLKSFLMAPIHKITRFPLLISTIVDVCEAQELAFQVECYDSALEALDAAKTLSMECDKAEDEISQKIKLIEIQKSLDMPDGTPMGLKVKLLSNQRPIESRKVIKEGEIQQVTGKAKLSALKTTKRYLFLFSDLLLITEFKSETKRFIALEVGKEFKVNRNRSDLHDRYGKKLNFTLANSFWTKCFFLQCVNWWKSVDFAQEDENGEPKVESSHKDFLFLLNDQADRDRWHEAIKGTIKLFPKLPEEPVPAEENKTWFSVIQSYEAKQADELTVYPGNFVKVFKPSNTWVKAILLNDKLSIGWLPTEYLSLETSLKSINEKEAKLRATKVNLDKLEKKLDPIIF